jgi:hypothetical protein
MKRLIFTLAALVIVIGLAWLVPHSPFSIKLEPTATSLPDITGQGTDIALHYHHNSMGCEDVTIFASGLASVADCNGALGQTNLTAPELTQLHGWLDSLASVDVTTQPNQAPSPSTYMIKLAGTGSQQADEQTIRALIEFSNQVFLRVSLSASETTWKTYTNAQAGFSIQYPSNWQEADLPDEVAGQRHQIVVKGPEGEVELIWGTGLGGACPEGWQALTVAKGTWPACHAQGADGTELWSLAAQAVGSTSFSGFVKTKDATAESREVVLKVVSTISLP